MVAVNHVMDIIVNHEPSYNQNYDDNYFPHESLSYACCDYCGGSHETFLCQPDNQNVDFSSSDQIQTLQYPDVNPPSPEINLKELAEYDQSIRMDHPIFLNDNEDHPVQNKESLENSSEENVVSKTNQESPQDSDIHQLIEECSVEVPKEQKQNMEKTIALDSKLLSINSINYQRLDKKEQEVKIVEEQPAGQPEHLLSMGYEHLSITPETESDEVTESNAENLLPILSKCEVSLKDEIECDMPAKDVCSPVFTTFSNPLFDYNNDFTSSDDESLPDKDVPAEEFKIYLNPLCDEDKINSNKLDPHCFNVESDFVESLLNRDTFTDFSSKFDFSGDLAHIKPKIPKFDFDFEEEIRLIENLLYDNSFPRLPEELNVEIADTIIESIPLPIQFRMELLINDSILSHESSDSNFGDSPLISRPPPEPPDDNFDLEPEDYPPEIEVILFWIYVRFPRFSYPLIDFSLG
nr:hypothetical protein [Tanacetum cinerariifolium]